VGAQDQLPWERDVKRTTSEDQPSTATRTSLYDLDPGPDCARVVRMIVEIPKNTSNKYEYDPQQKIFRLDRALYSPVHYPGEYGFAPGTIAEDGDPLDVLCLVDHPTFTGCVIEVRPIGVLNLIDQTQSDTKIVAVPLKDPEFEQVHAINDLPPHIMRAFEHFFAIYKELENKKVQTRGWGGEEDAFDSILASRQRYQVARSKGERERKV
jgi:inorganic pyrophosphatase